MDMLSLVEAAWEHRKARVSLVASENVLSPRALRALSSDLHNRYLLPEDKPESVWDYPDQEPFLAIHRRVCELANGIYGSTHAELRLLSGNNAAYALLNSLAGRGDTVLHVPADCGGHFATAPICQREGIRLIDIPFDRESWGIRLEALGELVRERRPSFLFLDASMLLFPYPLREIREAVGPDLIIAYDASHVFGLIAGARFQDPLAEGADLVSGSTHKTLFGPQKGMILSRERSLGKRISRIVVPMFVSNAHLHHIAALGVALEELEIHGPAYAGQTIANAKTLAARLHAGGVPVCAEERGFTESHQVWCPRPSREDAQESFHALEEIGIATNLIGIPMSDRFGLRLGTSEITRRGFTESDVLALADIIVDRQVGEDSAEHLRGRVADLALSRTDLEFHSMPDPD